MMSRIYRWLHGGFLNGDRVKITRKVNDYIWVDCMDNYVGLEGIVTEQAVIGGVRVKAGAPGEVNGFYFPKKALKRIT